MATIPDSHLDLLTSKAFAHFVTLMPDGAPQTSPVWCDFDGECALINTERGRMKFRNVQSDPRVALSVTAPENPYRYLEVRGRVVETVEQGGGAHADRLAQRYMGVDRYPYNQPGDVRVILRIRPEKASTLD
jgi:hypothetical protein